MLNYPSLRYKAKALPLALLRRVLPRSYTARRLHPARTAGRLAELRHAAPYTMDARPLAVPPILHPLDPRIRSSGSPDAVQVIQSDPYRPHETYSLSTAAMLRHKKSMFAPVIAATLMRPFSTI